MLHLLALVNIQIIDIFKQTTTLGSGSKHMFFFASFFAIVASKSCETCKNTEKGDFNQPLECVAPKGWSKHTMEIPYYFRGKIFCRYLPNNNSRYTHESNRNKVKCTVTYNITGGTGHNMHFLPHFCHYCIKLWLVFGVHSTQRLVQTYNTTAGTHTSPVVKQCDRIKNQIWHDTLFFFFSFFWLAWQSLPLTICPIKVPN